MTELISDVYPQALDAGISIALFWNSSLNEVGDMIESYNRRKLAHQREQALMNEVLAIQIGNMVSAMFSKNGRVRSVKELLPDLFKDDNHQEREWQNHMQKMREFTARHNQRRKEMN